MAQHAATPSSLEAPGTGALGWQRLENALIAASWTFHIGVDRALGYGLKLGPFTHTHLGRIGRSTERNYPSDGSSPG
ncbi:DUF4260 domain-containing protein [Nesterenkonia massiliensis]|uniref:DUF4260 domain-containing protein n=1 Tax=Nesterenkonia massiliensis TaxID=1232429 RepID=A0ABT2HMG2_9MICC|nr:DUF4260 family protein [Nesterenkonia massiliensis]MCT1605867.1 DUF4260 domain-containing protein [Nesterenkonia massiliensis]